MSIDMYLSESQAQASSAATMAESEAQAYEELEQALTAFIGSSETLKGQAYDSARSYAEQVLHPLVQGGKMLSEAIGSAVQRFPEAYVEQVSSESLKESELLADIQSLETAISEAEETMTNLQKDEPSSEGSVRLASYGAVIGAATGAKSALESKLEKLRTFDRTSPDLFSDIATLQALVDTGIGQLSSGWDASRGVYVLPADLTWATQINTAVALKDMKLTAEEQEYLNHLMSQYGFDVETAKQIIQVKRGIDKKFPDMSQEEKDYLLLLLLGQTTTEYDNFLWHNTAGNFRDYFNNASDVEDAYKELGLTDEETKKLVYNLRIQHEVTSGAYDDYEHLSSEQRKNFKKSAEKAYGITMTDTEFQEFWNEKYSSFRAKGNDEETSEGVPGSGNNADFTHQSITMATHLKPDFALAHLLGGKDNAEDLAGWEGDTTTNAEKTPSIGNDDYKSDLDAVNIVERMKKNHQSYLEASNNYYHELESGKTNRADEFTNHQSLDEVKDTIFRSLVPQKVYQIAPDVWGTKDRTEEESMTYLKENYPESYNFIKSLEQSKGDLNE